MQCTTVCRLTTCLLALLACSVGRSYVHYVRTYTVFVLMAPQRVSILATSGRTGEGLGIAEEVTSHHITYHSAAPDPDVGNCSSLAWPVLLPAHVVQYFAVLPRVGRGRPHRGILYSRGAARPVV